MKVCGMVVVFIILVFGAFSCDTRYREDSASRQCENGVQFYAYKGKLFSCLEYLVEVKK